MSGFIGFIALLVIVSGIWLGIRSKHIGLAPLSVGIGFVIMTYALATGPYGANLGILLISGCIAALFTFVGVSSLKQAARDRRKKRYNKAHPLNRR